MRSEILKDAEVSKKELIWINIIFFAVTTLVGVIGAPVYMLRRGVAPSEWMLFLFYIIATGMSITVGYHRLFAHRTFKANPLVDFLVLFFGAAAFEQSALKWASQHRDHHRFVDTERDPYSIKKGFFYAHIGWLMFWSHPIRYENARDLQQNRMLMHQHRQYHLWALGAGIFLPALIGALTGHLLGALILTVCLRLTVVYHSTFCINSVCHMFGKATYDIHSTAKDHWFVALLTFGEGYHNFHHHFPGDYRNAVRWYQWDPSKWAIFSLKCFGLAHDLKRVSEFRILEAKLAAQNQRARDWIDIKARGFHGADIRQKLEIGYKEIRRKLIQWEIATKNYQAVISERIHSSQSDMRTGAQEQLQIARKHFEAARRQWESFQLRQFGLAF